MRHRSCASKGLRVLLLLLLLLLGGLAAPAAAAAASAPASEVYLWGVRRNGCDFDEALNTAVESRLARMGERVHRVRLKAGSEIGNCDSAECSKRMRQICPQVSGTLLGGHLEERKVRRQSGTSGAGSGEEQWLRLRLWKIPMGAGLAAATVREHACRGCDAVDFVARNAAALIEESGGGHGALRCEQASLGELAARELRPDPDRVLLSVSSAREQREARRAVLDVLTRHLSLTGREVLPIEGKPGQPLAPLKKRHAATHVLDVGIAANEIVVQFLGPADTAPTRQKLECFGCSDDTIAHRVRMSAGALFDSCQGACSEEARVLMNRPKDVCAPMLPPMSCGWDGGSTSAQDDATPVLDTDGFAELPCARVAAEARRSRPATWLAARGAGRGERASRGRALKLAGGALLGLGAASLTTMLVVAVSDGRPGLGTCRYVNGGIDDVRGCEINIPGASTIAPVTGAAGGGLALAGGALLLLAYRLPSLIHR